MARQGQLSLQLVILSALTFILVSGFVVWAGALLNYSSRDFNKALAFSIAEAGIEYYRWHLAHAPTDYYDGNGTTSTGPYVHNYHDKEGELLGTFALTITPPPLGSSVVTVRSEGRVATDSSVVKIIEVRLGIPSLAQFAIAVNANVRFGSSTEVFGPIHSNGGIRFDGLAHNLIASAQPSYDDPDHGGQNEFGVHTHADPLDPLPPSAVPARPDVFVAGRAFPVPAVDFNQVTQTLASIKSQAQASGTYFGPSGEFGYDLVFATSGIFSLYKINVLTPPPNGCTNTSNESGWGTWSIQSETLYATSTIPDGGVIFIEDNLWVRGQIENKRITVGAGRFPDNPSTWANITINSSTLYTNYNGSDTIAYIAQNNFNVGLFSEDILRIDGAIIAQNGRAGRYYYSPPNTQSSADKCGDTVIRQRITLYGSVISNRRYGFGFTDSTGYIERILIYDTNLLFGPPPSFPLTGNQYTQLSWNELQ